ncbi:MAG: type II toxin-antitoxin system HicA family toxin [Nitrospirae bacterium]|nr:type II toxin-antitoxin system HicA family toxin [Nitrospirota bacterium]
MTKLPVCSGENAIRAFVRNGWVRDRQRGSHVTLMKPGLPVVLTIPLHRELGPGLLRSLIRKAGLTVDEFQSLFQ